MVKALWSALSNNKPKPEKKLMEEPNLLSTAMIEDLSGKNLLVARNLDYKPILWSYLDITLLFSSYVYLIFYSLS